MFPQMSQIQAQSHQQDLTMAAERAHLAASVKHQGVFSKGFQRVRRARWNRAPQTAPQTAPAPQPRVTVA